MVRVGFRASWRRADSPTSTPSGVNATMDGSSARPSASAITLGIRPSVYATRLLVVPRSMPTMRDMRVLILSERVAQVVDHRAEIRPRGQSLLEPRQERFGVASGIGHPIPLPEARDDGGFPGGLTHDQALPRLGEPAARRLVQPATLGRLERLLDLEHLLEQVHGHLGLDGGALPGLASLLE